MKEYAVNVLSAAFKHKLILLKYPGNESKALSAHRKFRANTLQFSKIANQVRSYNEKETETDILMKLIDTLRSDVEDVKTNQQTISVNIAKVIGFMKNIDLQPEDGDT